MFDFHSHLRAFHDDCVTLTNDMKEGMRERRQINQTRLVQGLIKAQKPKPLCHIKQGSYAMHTMVQSEYAASDIDDGVVFAKTDLVGSEGDEYTAQDAKTMVYNALNNSSFKRKPEIHTNCVRIYYDDGFTLDIPVYREKDDFSYELASANWKPADPKAVTNWFNNAVISKSPDEENGRQMRRVVKLLKAWCRSRKDWDMPSGLILSMLVDEIYYKDESLISRDDKALLQTLERISNRLTYSLIVPHPVVVGETLTKTTADANMINLRDRLKNAIQKLSSILRCSECTELDALKAFRDFFSTDYFDSLINKLEEEEENSTLSTVTGKEPTQPVDKGGNQGCYA